MPLLLGSGGPDGAGVGCPRSIALGAAAFDREYRTYITPMNATLRQNTTKEARVSIGLGAAKRRPVDGAGTLKAPRGAAGERTESFCGFS